MTLGGVPILVQNAASFISRHLDKARRHGADQKAMIARLSSCVNQPEHSWRRPVITRWMHALERNLDIVDGLIGELEQAAAAVGTPASVDAVEAPELDPHYGFRNLHYLWADWTDSADTARQRHVTRQALETLIAPCSGRAVMLGAGTGRYAVDLAPRFDQLTALELCPLYAYLFTEVRRRRIEFYISNAFSPASVETLVQRHVTVRPAVDGLAHTAYAIADACRMPLRDGSQDVVIAVYFLDIVPLRRLVPEIARVLRPGGRFVAYGPLRYHFDDPLDTLGPEEITAVFERCGLTLVTVSWQDAPFFSSQAQAGYLMDRTGAWAFERREQSDGPAHRRRRSPSQAEPRGIVRDRD